MYTACNSDGMNMLDDISEWKVKSYPMCRLCRRSQLTLDEPTPK
jgi:hypothetical protein